MTDQGSISSARLLARLGSGVRPGEGAARGSAQGEFAALLERAQRGELRSGRVVTADARFGIGSAALEALSAAADAAEAAGARSLLAIGEGDAIRVDVAGRRVEERGALEAGRVERGADAIVALGAVDGDGEGAVALHAPPGWISNRGLFAMLGRVGDGPDGGDAALGRGSAGAAGRQPRAGGA